MPKILCIGHVTLDTFLKVEQAEVHCDVNTKDCVVCFEFGSKVPVEDVHYAAGGGAANLASGLKLLGCDSSIFSILGKDTKGEEVIEALKSKDVDLSLIEYDENPTDQSSIISYSEDRTIFTYGHPRKYSIKSLDLSKYDAIFVSSIGKDVKGLYKEVIEAKKANPDLVLFYNPGSREIQNSRDEILELLEFTDHLLINVEEGCSILNPGLKRSQIEIGDLLNLLKEKGTKNIVLTDAENGAYVIGADYDFEHIEAKKVTVVEKTGAGDAFSSGYSGAILHGFEIGDAVRFGVENGSNAIQTVGAQNGLLNKNNMISFLGNPSA